MLSSTIMMMFWYDGRTTGETSMGSRGPAYLFEVAATVSMAGTPNVAGIPSVPPSVMLATA
jgi:hypothetical protein